MSISRHTYKAREVGFFVEAALSPLSVTSVEWSDNGGAVEIYTTPDPLHTLRDIANWTKFSKPGSSGSFDVPAGTRKVAIEATSVDANDQPSVTVVSDGVTNMEQARLYGVDQLTVPEPDGPAGAFPLIWYDFADPSVLFQDLAMTIPVDTDGQTVEAVADKGSAGYHLDEPSAGSGPTLVEKPTYIASGLNGLSALGYDRTANGNFGQNIRTSKDDIEIDVPIVHLLVAEWQNAGTGFTGLTAHFVDDSWQGQQTTARVIGTAADSGASRQIAGYSIFAGWIENRSDGGSLRLNSVAGIDSAVKAVGDWKASPDHLAVGGNQNGGAGTAGWHGSFSEWIVWQGTKLPSLTDVEEYVTDRFGLTWL